MVTVAEKLLAKAANLLEKIRIAAYETELTTLPEFVDPTTWDEVDILLDEIICEYPDFLDGYEEKEDI